MTVYTYSEARQKFAQILNQVLAEGEVRIKRKDGRMFVIKSEPKRESPLDVKGVKLGLTADEIVGFIREGRRGVE